MKIIKLTESDLEKIVKRVLVEQTKGNLPAATLTPSQPQKSSLQPTMNTKSGTYNSTTKTSNSDPSFNELVNILFNARNVSWDEGVTKTLFNRKSDIEELASALIKWSKKNGGYDPKLFKAIVTFIFRESKGSSFQVNNPKEILGRIHNFFGGDHSQGYGQFKPSTAKKYGIDMSKQYELDGSLDALYKMTNVNYQNAKKFYGGPTITVSENKKYKEIPAIGGDAALHLTIAAHNAGEGIIDQWCETNIPGIANKCSEAKRQPYEDSRPDIVAVTDKTKRIKNYFPNIGDVHTYMPQFVKAYQGLANLPKVISQAKIPN
jgi:hypothetical protein